METKEPKSYERRGVRIPEILLPKECDVPTWAAIACDQYTQDKDYWKRAAEIAAGRPSTLNLIFPEAYLGDGDGAARTERIHAAMREYLDGGIFREEEEAIYVERTTGFGRTRRGLVVALDLETYDWRPGTRAPVRATEATVPERIPPRMAIRRGAAIELPHIMLLVNDRARRLVEATGEAAKADGEKAYDGDLMLGGGHVTGWKVRSGRALSALAEGIEAAARENTDADGTFLFAVGDGNHSLATAKAVWDEHKAVLSEEERETSRVRFALVEIVNIYDEGLTFEPIHRVVLNRAGAEVAEFVRARLGGTLREAASAEELREFVGGASEGARFGFASGGKFLALQTEVRDLAIAALQPALDELIESSGGRKEDIDYIHGAEDALRLGGGGSTAILLPPVDKDSFFQTISRRGVLPRKSFSMGEASEKRYYVEARRLFG